MITSADINKVIRRELSPVLKQHGFSKVRTRHNWGWHGQCTWVLDIRAVGSHFRDVTGWPSMSVCVWLGVYYSFIPLDIPSSIPSTSDGNPLPKELDAQMRSHLNCSLEQLEYKSHLGDRDRTDIWWVEPDGSNTIGVVTNIAAQFVAEGLPWFQGMTNLEAAFLEIEDERDCYVKFYRASFFAHHLGLTDKYNLYRQRLIDEAARIGHTHWLPPLP